MGKRIKLNITILLFGILAAFLATGAHIVLEQLEYHKYDSEHRAAHVTFLSHIQ